MRNLLKNERLKLYKKVSTWVLAGVVVGLAVLMLLIQGGSELWMVKNMGSSDGYSWEDNYADMILSLHNQQKDAPQDKTLQLEKEKYEYLLNNSIPPDNWKSDLVLTYYSVQQTLYDTEQQLTEQGVTDFTKNAEWNKYADMAASYKRLMGASDWKEYVRLQIEEVQNGHTEFETPEEKQVQIDILNMYLDYNVEPVSTGRISVGGNYYYGDSSSMKKSWQQTELESLKSNKLALLRNELTGDYGDSTLLTSSDRQKLEDRVALSTERLKTDTAPVESLSLYGLMETSLSSFSLLSIFLIVLAGGIISSEFGNGTIKLLLISPHKRRSIFWSKVLILLEITLIATGAMFVLSFLLSGVLGGFNGIGSMYMSTLFGSIVRLPYILVILYKYLLFLLPVLAFGALALMLSAVTRKTAVATAVSILMLYGGNLFTTLATMLSSYFIIPGAKFLLFTNTGLGSYFVSPSGMFGDMSAAMGLGSGLVDNSMTLLFSVAILLVYTVCFLWIARDSFCRRDVK